MARRKQTPQLSRTTLLIGFAVIVLVIAGAGLANWKAGIDRQAAMARAEGRWAGVKQTIVARLHQPYPIELGAVWVMHTGRICGLVNGKGSFGGLTGMTPFFTEGQRVVFSFDVDPVAFGRPWLDCSGDSWITLVQGSAEEGYCATKAGAAHCHMTDHVKSGF